MRKKKTNLQIWKKTKWRRKKSWQVFLKRFLRASVAPERASWRSHRSAKEQNCEIQSSKGGVQDRWRHLRWCNSRQVTLVDDRQQVYYTSLSVSSEHPLVRSGNVLIRRPDITRRWYLCASLPVHFDSPSSSTYSSTTQLYHSASFPTHFLSYPTQTFPFILLPTLFPNTHSSPNTPSSPTQHTLLLSPPYP